MEVPFNTQYSDRARKLKYAFDNWKTGAKYGPNLSEGMEALFGTGNGTQDAIEAMIRRGRPAVFEALARGDAVGDMPGDALVKAVNKKIAETKRTIEELESQVMDAEKAARAASAAAAEAKQELDDARSKVGAASSAAGAALDSAVAESSPEAQNTQTAVDLANMLTGANGKIDTLTREKRDV